uniref:BHLH domain-containing protein n=1 Tax=Anisakis simplex TaxID=6269 RepID=A0A0M3IZ25_ANISI
LETVAALLPYDQSVISRLDKLSVLRLAVSYLQLKAHFQGLFKYFDTSPCSVSLNFLLLTKRFNSSDFLNCDLFGLFPLNCKRSYSS